MNRRLLWETVYQTKAPDQVSWFQAEARLSLGVIERLAPDRGTETIDIGAGASTLVDGLLASGYRRLTVLDISPTALSVAQRRLGTAASGVSWLEGDVLDHPLPPAAFDLWHDRAVFHFLTDPVDRDRYVAAARRAVRPGGHLIVATFAEDGPPRCSGLEVVRYSPAALHEVFGEGFRLVESHRELHVTPSGAQQAFTYCICEVLRGAGQESAA